MCVALAWRHDLLAGELLVHAWHHIAGASMLAAVVGLVDPSSSNFALFALRGIPLSSPTLSVG